MTSLILTGMIALDLNRHIYPLAPAQPAPRLIVDTSAYPSAAAWAEDAKIVFSQWWPIATTLLATEGFKGPKEVRLVFRPKQDAPAWANGNEISVSGDWITAHPDDFGMIVHELTHLVQKYPGNKADVGWLVEGIADYVRWWRYEPEATHRRIDPAKAKYSDGYGTTASLLAWASRKYHMGLVPALDRVLKKGEDPAPTFQALTGKTYQQAWDEFVKA